MEALLLEAWSQDPTRPLTLLSSWLSAEETSRLQASRQRFAEADRARDASAFLAHVFQALPRPVLLRTESGTTWNEAFSRALAAEVTAGRQRSEVLQRFHLLIDRSGTLRVPALFVPLGGRAFSLHREDFPGGTALYLAPLELALPDLPVEVLAIALCKASGLVHKQIADLCGSTKSRVDRISSLHRAVMTGMRASLCRVRRD